MATKETNKLKLELFNAERSLHELKLRSTGRTTRLIDEAIQQLFCKPDEWIPVADHKPEKRAQRRIIDIIRGRLKAEHHAEVDVRYDTGGCFIRLKEKFRPNRDYQKLEIRILEEIIQKLRNELEKTGEANKFH